MKNILIAIAVVMLSVVFVAAGVAAVSSPCSGYTKPAVRKAAPVKSAPVEQDYRRDVLGQKVPIYTHEAGDALTDTATKYESQLVTGEE